MKYKYISIITVVLIITSAFILQNPHVSSNRYHQHLESPEKPACTNHAEDDFCTHLPLICIKTDNPIPDSVLYVEDNTDLNAPKQVPVHNNEMVSATVQYFDNESSNNHLTDTPTFSERALIRTRGSSSRYFDKKGYLLKFKEENLIDNKDVSFSGMTPDSSWVLHGPFLDKSLIRNYLCYNLSGEIMGTAPNVRFCEMYLNGEYQGLYLIIEKVGYNADGRISLSKSDPKLSETSYIVQLDRGTHDPLRSLNTFGSFTNLINSPNSNSGQYEIIYPSSTLTENQRTFIENDISHFEKALTSFDFRDSKLGYSHYIDVDSFVDYFLINEFCLNYDAMGLSTFIYRDVRGKIKLCVWDFNSSFDYYTEPYLDNQSFQLHMKGWYRYLFKDPSFVKSVINRYHQLRKTYLNEEYLMQYIDDTIAYLGPAIERNYDVWGYSFQSEYNGINYDYLNPTQRNPRSHDEAVQQLKDCISRRLKYMDEQIETLFAFSHESINKDLYHKSGGR